MAEHHHDTPAIPTENVDAGGVRTLALIAAAGGLIALGVMAFLNFGSDNPLAGSDLSTAYLTAFLLWSSIPLGSLFLMLIGIVTSASWGVVLRRCFTAALRTMWLVPVLFLPIAVSLFIGDGTHSPYWWSDHKWDGDVATVAAATHLRPEAVEENQHKIHDLLNPVRYLIVTGVGMVVMGVLTLLTLSNVRKHETDESAATYSTIRRFAGPGVVVWVLTMLFLSTIWVMSTEPTWASSMFPIVYGMDCFLAAYTFCIFVFYSVSANSPGTMAVVKEKFRIDIGTLTLAITMVWAYATFSQYMLIWAGNLPEETSYYLKRGDHGWEYLAYFLMAFHWLVPFVALLFREVKTDTRLMRGMCVLLFTVIAADIIWWVVPSIPHESGRLHVPMAVAAIVGVGGVWSFVFARELGSRPALPANSEGQFVAAWGEHH